MKGRIKLLKSIPFIKMHGLGNCYIYIDLVTHDVEIPSYTHAAIKVADPHTGIGADGMILILPSAQADIMMRIFNKDGSEGKNCGNGLRCVAKYAYEHHLVATKDFTIETLSSIVQAEVVLKGENVELVTINMGIPLLERNMIPMAGDKQHDPVINEPLMIQNENYLMTAVSMGNPHGLFFVDDIDDAPLHKIGPILADSHPIFPEGLNVGFVELSSVNHINYRVWERGSGITQACGTGACAAVVASILGGHLQKDQTITVHLTGGDLDITWVSATEQVLMTGEATLICVGNFYL